MIRILTSILGVILVLAITDDASAQARFYLETEIFRPAMEKKINVGGSTKYIRVRRPTGNTKHPDYEEIRWKPATYQLVELYSPGSFHPIYCGKAYTDSKGMLKGNFYCGNAFPTKLYLQIRGDSRRGFRVGSNSPWPWEYLEVAYAYTWVTAQYAFKITVDPQKSKYPVMTFPSQYLGKGRHFETIDFRAAAMVEMIDFLYSQLNIGSFAVDKNQVFNKIYTSWIVNDVGHDVFLSAPYTYWQTIHMPQNKPSAYVLGAVGHELGHALFNKMHSDKGHYLGDVNAYLKEHYHCKTYGFRFGHYEGFAHAVDSLAWRQYENEELGSDEYDKVEPHCSDAEKGIEREANINEFYIRAFGGPDFVREVRLSDEWARGTVEGKSYAFPPTTRLFTMVGASGMNGEDLRTFWSSYLGNMCASQTNVGPAYCGSDHFKCTVNKYIARPGDPLPSGFLPASKYANACR